MADDILLTVDDLHRPGLASISLSLARGEIVTVSGPSGSGKSLFLRALADLDPNEGRVALDGAPRECMPAPAWRRRVTYVPAESGWWTDTVEAHMPDPRAARGFLPVVGLDEDALSWPVARLSTGEKQRLSLIRALSQAPAVLLLDEPTSGLDPKATDAVEKLIRETCAAGTAAVVVTHDTAQSARLGAARHYRMDGGALTEEDRHVDG